MMDKKALTCLIVEDNIIDAKLLRSALKEDKICRLEVEVAESLASAIGFIRSKQPDIILVDLNISDSSGLATFETIHREAPQTPIIILTAVEDGQIGEDAMKMGAQDFIIKGRGDSSSIVRSIHHAIQRKMLQEEIQNSEEKYRTLIENVNIGVYRNTGGPKGRFIQANPAIAKMFGYDSVEEFMQVNVSELYRDPEQRKMFVEEIAKNDFVKDKELFLKKKDGTHIIASCTAKVQRDDQGNIKWMDGVIEDITERKRYEKENERKMEELIQKNKHFFNKISKTVKFVSTVILIVGLFLTVYLGNKTKTQIVGDGQASVASLSEYFKEEMKEAKNVSKILTSDPVLIRSLIRPDVVDKNILTKTLNRYCSVMDDAICYIMNEDGVTIASSYEPLLGKSYKFRPYFAKAVVGKPAEYFALGVTTNQRGYYASYPIMDGSSKVLGVGVVKKQIGKSEEIFQKFKKCYLVDNNGIIFLSSNENLLYKSLWPVSNQVMDEIIKSRQFGNRTFVNIYPMELTALKKIMSQGQYYLVFRKIINEDGWSIVLIKSLAQVTIYRLFTIFITLILFCTTVGFLVFLRKREIIEPNHRES